MSRYAWITGWVLAASLASASYAETLEDAKKQITEKLAGLKSASMKSKADQEYATEEFQFKSHSEGLTEYALDGDKKWKSRSESRISATRKLKEQEEEEKEDGKMLFIYDGEFAYTLSEAPGHKSAIKTKPNAGDMPNPFDGKAMFALLEKDHTLRLLPGEKVDGKDTFVIEAKPKKEDAPTANFMARSVTYYHKDSGIALKQVAYDKAGKTVLTMLVEDLKLNPEIKPDRFVFKAPPDVTVVDMTQMQESPAPQQADESSQEQGTADQDDATAEEPETAKSDQTTSDEQAKDEKKEDEGGAKGLFKKLKLR